ncbi:MAG: hypothetical protein D6815_11910 [Candidatus Dadabacteria bacterium]|nr:MAG: hypothetical protein D6815_11910 [Candidatus Dadabacteria bacterium]
MKVGRQQQQVKVKVAAARRRQRGTSLVEFALLIPVFMMIVVGIVDLGRAVWAKSSLGYLAGETARYAAMHSARSNDPATAGDISKYVEQRAVGLNPKHLKVATTWAPNNAPGGVVRINLTYDFRFITPLIPTDQLTLTANARRVITN